MKNLKTVVKRASSPKPSHAANQLQPLPSQRSKANSQQLFKKYNQNAPADLTRQSALPNKYRIVTEPMDDHLLQLSKSYAKLSRSKRKETKFDSQHNSIKSRQKTISNDRYQPTTQNVCPNCLKYLSHHPAASRTSNPSAVNSIASSPSSRSGRTGRSCSRISSRKPPATKTATFRINFSLNLWRRSGTTCRT